MPFEMRLSTVSRKMNDIASSIVRGSALYKWKCVVLGIVLASVGLAGCAANMQERDDEEAVPEGWTSLFNGEDLSGWIVPEGRPLEEAA